MSEPITTLHDILARSEWEADADRDSTKISPSGIDPMCSRQQAFTVTLTPESDDPDPVTVATVGTLIHAGVAALWMQEPETEDVEVAIVGGGHADCYQVFDDGTHVVRDLKTVGRSKFDRWDQMGTPIDGVWDQLTIYADRMGADESWVLAVDALCRETGRTATYFLDFDPARAADLQATLQRVQDRYDGVDPMTVPATRSGHGDWICDSCPWLTMCCGEQGPPTPGTLTEEQAADAAREYATWSAVARDADAKAKAAKNALRGAAGTFGGYKVAWRDVEPTFIEGYERKGYSTLTVKAVKS